MTSVKIKRMNSYPEFKTANGINTVKDYILSLNHNQPPAYPPNLNTRQRLRWFRKFPINDWVVHINTLFYRPRLPPPNQPNQHNQRIILQVIDPANIQAELLRIFQDPTQGQGLGLNQFYSQVCSQFIGIKRLVTTAFLKTQGNYQVTRTYKKVVNRPILAQVPNERWCVDCIHLKKYVNLGNYKYILSVVDHFSKFVWAEPITDPLNTLKCRNAFERIMTRANTTPHIVQSDNGKSDFGLSFANLMRDHRPQIKWIQTSPYTPQSNGMIERINREIRKKIKIGMATNNNFEWKIHLQSYCDNINNQKSSRTKFKPIELWSAGYNPPANNRVKPLQDIDDHSTPQEIQTHVQTESVKSAKKMLNKQHVEDLNVNDIVRIKVEVIDKLMRKRNEAKMEKKLNIVNYTPANYLIVRKMVSPVNNNFSVSRDTFWLNGYSLQGIPDVPLLANNGRKSFFSSDLLKIPAGSTAPTITNWQRVRQINRLG